MAAKRPFQKSFPRLICSLHNMELNSFCLEDKELVCSVCQNSEQHRGHSYRSIYVAAVDMKEELKDKLKSLKKKQDAFDQAAADNTSKAQHTENKIKQEFEDIRKFLQDEEAARIAALKRKEEQKSEKMSGEISSLSNTIRFIEEEMEVPDVRFLQNYKITVERAQYKLQDRERLSGALFNVPKHLGNLKFRVWEKMMDIVQYTPVTLDPNTAHPQLILSEDLSSVRRGEAIQPLPDNPERFDEKYSVVGYGGFNSGTHYWDVDVGGNTFWNVGVMAESFQRRGNYTSTSGRWYLWYDEKVVERCGAIAPPVPHTFLKINPIPQRIRVQLDWERGLLSFTDLDNDTHLHTFTHNFTERVFPYFNISSKLSLLRMLPAKALL